MGKHRSSGAPAYDQFGELGLPQDREESQRQGQRQGQRFGGGGASGPSPIVYERHVPKFLQPYAHLIDKRRNPFDGGGGGEEAGARGRAGLEQAEDGDDDRDQAEAIQRALEENPELAKELGSEVVDKARALAEKEAGNEAFSEGRYEDAVKRFTECIKLDGSNEIYYSNRSAAHAKAGDFPSALRDAEAALRLKPRWVKGWARKAAALQGLNYHSEAKEAYERALEIEPDDETLRKGYEKAFSMEQRQMRDKKHTFRKRESSGSGARSGASKRGRWRRRGGGCRDSKLLSFGDEEDDDGDGDEDAGGQKAAE